MSLTFELYDERRGIQSPNQMRVQTPETNFHTHNFTSDMLLKFRDSIPGRIFLFDASVPIAGKKNTPEI